MSYIIIFISAVTIGFFFTFQHFANKAAYKI